MGKGKHRKGGGHGGARADRPDRLATRLIQRSLEFYRRRPWLQCMEEDGLIVEFVDPPGLAVASVIGASGESHGLTMVLGDSAIAAYLQIRWVDDGDDGPMDRAHHLVFTVVPQKHIPARLRGVHEAAKAKAAREALTPFFVAKSPYEDARNPSRAEQRMMLLAIDAILAASDQGDLKPISPESGQMLTLRVEGAAGETVQVEARFQSIRKFARSPIVPRAGLPPEGSTEHSLGEEVFDDLASESEPESEFEYWRAADDEVTMALFELHHRKPRSPDRSRRRYLGPEHGAMNFGEREHMVVVAFFEWLLIHDRPTARSRTTAETLLRSDHGLSEDEVEVLRARIEAKLGFYRVEEATAGESIVLTDIVTGQSLVVHDVALSRSIPEGVILPLRTYPAGPFRFCGTAGPPIEAFGWDAAVAELERVGLQIPEGLVTRPELVGRLWAWSERRRSGEGAPRLTNAHGDPLQLHTITYRVEDGDLARSVIHARPDIDAEATDGIERWLIPAPEGWVGDHVSGGALEWIGDQLLVEVNSTARVARIREWLDVVPGISFLRSAERPIAEKSADAKLPRLGEAPLSEETVSVIAEAILKVQLAWLDQSVPALGGRTPREAVKDERGRQMVRQLILTMPDAGGPGGRKIPAPRNELLRELGLDLRG